MDIYYVLYFGAPGIGILSVNLCQARLLLKQLQLANKKALVLLQSRSLPDKMPRTSHQNC